MLRQFAHVAPAAAGTTPAATAALIERRRTACAVLGITGALVHTGRDFFELFEGSAASVGRLASSLALESAFREPRVLLDRPVATRWFHTWRAGEVPPPAFEAWMASIALALPRGDLATEELRQFLDATRRG